MKILYITSYPLEYSSSANMRNIALIKGLVELGHSVSTLSSNIEKDSVYYDDSILNFELEKRYWIEIGQLHSKFTTKNHKTSKINKLKKQLINKMHKIYTKFRIYDSRKYLARKVIDLDIKEKFDLIISSSDPKSSHLIAEQLIKLNPEITKRWIQYWGDPFANDINKNTLIPTFLIKKEEKRIISKCDKIVYVSPFTLDKQKKTYPKYSNLMEFYPIAYINKKIYRKKLNNIPKIGYFGDYYSKDRNVLNLYNCCNGNFMLTITGNSDLNLKSNDNIKILPRQKKEVVDKYEGESDILVCICNNKGTQIPGKVYHYAATNKPILIILDGDYKHEIKKYFSMFKRYYMCDNNEKEIKKSIKKIVKENKKFSPCPKLSAKNIAQEFLK